MLRFFRNTSLYKQVQDALAEYRSVRIAEHRTAMRLKRAAVRSRVMYEIQKQQMERAALGVVSVRSEIRRASAEKILKTRDEVRKKMEAAAAARGVVLPIAPPRAPPPSTSPSTGDPPSAEQFKSDVIRNVQKMIPGDTVVASKIAGDMLRDSVEKIPLQGKDPTTMSINLIAGLARQVGASKKEIGEMLGQAAGEKNVEDVEMSRKLKESVFRAMEEQDKNSRSSSRQ